MNDFSKLYRNKKKVQEQLSLLDDDEFYKQYWWDMPEFEMDDVSAQYSVKVNFLTYDDLKAFSEKIGIPLTTKSDSCWFPNQPKLNGEFEYNGPKIDSKYPICIMSKGRYDCQTTGKLLDNLGVSYNFFVEETEYDKYCKYIGEQKVIKLPFHDLGKGSIPARNFIWDWAKENGYKRHWTLDDNIMQFGRCNNNRRLSVKGGGYFRAMEDFVDRFENIAMAGPHDYGFVPDRQKIDPFLFNSRVYSCILLDTTLDYRWRGRYNEDTDLSLRLLKDGFCTVLFRSLIMNKGGTAFAKGRAMKGGNTDNVYNSNDYRLAFAESLKKQHPDCVDVVWRFGRWHHKVDYSKFKNNKPILKKGVVKTKTINNYGMELKKIK